MGEDAVVTTGQARVRISTASGRVKVVAEQRDDVEITVAGVTEHQPASAAIEVVKTAASDRVEVRCPVGSDVMVGTSSGGVRLDGRFGAVRVTTTSGTIKVDTVTSADLRSKSATIEVESCLGSCRITTTSGGVEVGQAGEAAIGGVSGTIRVTAGEAQVRTVSGTVKAHVDTGVAVETVSGSVTITVPPGFRPHLRSHSIGRIKVDVPQGDDGDIAVRTVSGSVKVRSR